MKLSSFALPLLAFVTSAAAQASHIGYPPAGTRVHRGQDLTVQIVRPNSIMGSIEVGLVLSFQYCKASGTCPNPTNELGSIMYVGKLDPDFHEIPGKPYENFTVTLPNFDFVPPGPAQIIENRFHLIGGGPAAVLETNTVFVNVVD
ncbi:hypothetical protein AN958_10880 [Leucoagaricus sp. SymC.cos]|nr:hypothetical protein AN958_10880 [Leucoagaricus sp. SymC.cos]